MAITITYPLTVALPVDGGDKGIWGPIADNIIVTLVAYINDLQVQLANRPTSDQLNAAVNAAVAQALQAF